MIPGDLCGLMEHNTDMIFDTLVKTTYIRNLYITQVEYFVYSFKAIFSLSAIIIEMLSMNEAKKAKKKISFLQVAEFQKIPNTFLWGDIK